MVMKKSGKWAIIKIWKMHSSVAFFFCEFSVVLASTYLVYVIFEVRLLSISIPTNLLLLLFLIYF